VKVYEEAPVTMFIFRLCIAAGFQKAAAQHA